MNVSQKGKDHGDEGFKVPSDLLGITKPFISVEIPCFELNEIKFKHFLKKFHKSTKDAFRVVTTWETRNIRYFFNTIKKIK